MISCFNIILLELIRSSKNQYNGNLYDAGICIGSLIRIDSRPVNKAVGLIFP
jgi:hypothetical protein